MTNKSIDLSREWGLKYSEKSSKGYVKNEQTLLEPDPRSLCVRGNAYAYLSAGNRLLGCIDFRELNKF